MMDILMREAMGAHHRRTRQIHWPVVATRCDKHTERTGNNTVVPSQQLISAAMVHRIQSSSFTKIAKTDAEPISGERAPSLSYATLVFFLE